jgi:2-keto-4-pentenoate hydratase/2-oxohepta-3-ene-1,7-dioic acid hydratase in catechol pathway
VILATFRYATGDIAIGAVQRAGHLVLDLKRACAAAGVPDRGRYDSMLAMIEAGEGALEQAQKLAQTVTRTGDAIVPLSEVRLLSPLPVPSQIRDFTTAELHAQQAGAAIARLRAQRLAVPPPPPETIKVPEVLRHQPIYYKGNRFSVIGHEADVVWPSYSKQLDYELEFGVFLSRRGVNIPLQEAGQYIFGYSIFNDFSARDAQEIEMSGPLGPAKGKDFDSGNAIGPWIVTPDEIGDPRRLTMVARVNGEQWSRNNSACLLYGFEELIAFVSRDETLYPGEFFGSGTVGNGCGLELDRWLKPGDVVELEVENIGILRNRVGLGSSPAAAPDRRRHPGGDPFCRQRSL